MAYRPCGCYVGTNGAVVIRCSRHGAKQWHEGGKQQPVTHPDEKRAQDIRTIELLGA